MVRECGGVVVAGPGLGFYRPKVAHGEVLWTSSMATRWRVLLDRDGVWEV